MTKETPERWSSGDQEARRSGRASSSRILSTSSLSTTAQGPRPFGCVFSRWRAERLAEGVSPGPGLARHGDDGAPAFPRLRRPLGRGPEHRGDESEGLLFGRNEGHGDPPFRLSKIRSCEVYARRDARRRGAARPGAVQSATALIRGATACCGAADMITDRSGPDSRRTRKKEQRRMKYEGQAIQTLPLDGGFVELRFDLKGDSVNKFNALTIGELKEVVEGLARRRPPKGLLVTSGKDVFIVGADVTEFLGHFKKSEEELAALAPRRRRGLLRASRTSPCPSVVAHQRLLPRRRLRARALGRSFRAAVDGGEGRPPRDEARHLPRLGRHGPPLADVRGRQRDRVDRQRRAVPGRGRRSRSARSTPSARPPTSARSPSGCCRTPPTASSTGRPAATRRRRPLPLNTDRGGDGLRRGEGVRRRQGRPELPVPGRRDRGDAEGRRARAATRR